MIKLYCIKINDCNKSEFSDIMSSRYRETNSNIISNFAWYCLEDILFKEYHIKVTKEMILYNEFGKPYLKNNEVYFNISHCDRYVLIGISDYEIGVDIEPKVDINKANKLIQKFSLDVIEEYNQSDCKEEYFSKKWVLLEAYSKMLGTGISFDLMKTLKLSDEEIFTFYDKDNGKKYYCAAINNINEKIGEMEYVL